LGLGYRARYVVETAARVKDKGGMHWLHCLRLQSREDATAALTELTGVGPKVADCVALFSLDQHSCIPVDTHVWAIACREMDPTLREAKSITPKIYKRVGDLFRDRYGDKAGWAHCLLFIAELPAFRKLLPQRMQDSIEEFAKEERAAKALKKEAAKAKRQAKANSQAAASSSSSSSPSAVGASAVSPVKRERSATASADPASYTPKRDC
jgi:N-glycosylase/DNA lyase